MLGRKCFCGLWVYFLSECCFSSLGLANNTSADVLFTLALSHCLRSTRGFAACAGNDEMAYNRTPINVQNYTSGIDLCLGLYCDINDI